MAIPFQQRNAPKVEVSPNYDKLFDADLAAKGTPYRWMMSLEDCQWQYEHAVEGQYD